MNWEWWNDAEVQREIGLAPDKIKRIDDFYQRRNKELEPIVQEFLKQSSELDQMTRAAVTDQATYTLQVLRVEALLSHLRQSRTIMLYRMYLQLKPDQYKKLQDIFARHRFGRGRGPSNSSPK